MMYELLAHPAVPPGPLLHVRAGAHVQAPGTLALRYELAGELADLLIPGPVAAPRRRDGLWQHSCCELFLRRAGQHAYLECNFSPSGDWAAWVFSEQRTGAVAPAMTAPRIEVQRVADSALTLQVALALPAAFIAAQATSAPAASPARPAGPDDWQLGLCAVLETQGGQISYWALAHPRPQPDFHDAGGHVLALPDVRDEPGSTA